MASISEIFPDYQSARATCGAGYDDAELAQVVAAKTLGVVAQLARLVMIPEQVGNSLMALTWAAGFIQHRPLRVLDFGGACGIHFYYALRFLNVPLKWAIVETPQNVKAGKGLSNSALSFHATIAEARATLGFVDIVHTSGAISYLPDPLVGLTSLLVLDAPTFLLARFPVWRGKTTVGVQTSRLADDGLGPTPPDVGDKTIRYPIVFNNHDEVMGMFVSNYDLEVRWRSYTTDYSVRGAPALGENYVFRRRREAR